uniref:DC_STAMP domain-containing protein n=1 Tax=Heterorhabditis bacteriophora TaxID=37862 RepID=A0A1I7XL00_HETBA
MTAAKEVVQGLFIFCVYSIFRDAVRMINNYTTDVEFNNRFINELFWKIDDYRRNKGQLAMLRMTTTEMTTWKLMKVFSKPTKAELRAAKKPFINWVITAIIASSLIVIDHYLYSFLNSVKGSGENHV